MLHFAHYNPCDFVNICHDQVSLSANALRNLVSFFPPRVNELFSLGSMSWGSHLAEGERNGKKASTQVGHGSRWDTDCTVVYSCWGPSTSLYRGQSVCLPHFTAPPRRCRHLPGDIGNCKETWRCRIFLGFSATWLVGWIILILFVNISYSFLNKRYIINAICTCSRKVRLKWKKDSREWEKGDKLEGKPSNTKGLWRSLTFLYVRIESLSMVLLGTLTI